MAAVNKMTGLGDFAVELRETANLSPRRVVLQSMTVVDFATMAPPKDKKFAPAPEPHWWDPSRHGNWAQWAAFLGVIFSIALTLWFHYTASATIASDEHMGTIVDGKLNPIVKDINENITKQLGPINDRLNALTQQVGQLQGRFQQLDTGQKKLENRLGQQEALNRLQDPGRILATIRAEIQTAENQKQLLPASQLADYRNAVRALSSSTLDFWKTSAAIINYQSLINQLSGEAPDPAKVSKPCGGLTTGGRLFSHNNMFQGLDVSNCVVDLDTNAFENVTFRNSVIRYHGGPVSLANVSFINCRFVLELKTPPSTPAQKNLLLALLDSPDQKTVQFSK